MIYRHSVSNTMIKHYDITLLHNADCYTRVAIGFKLSDMDIFSSVAVGSISECEDECSKRRNSCNAFTFGYTLNNRINAENSNFNTRKTELNKKRYIIKIELYILIIKK